MQSNLHTFAVESMADHPFPYLLREGYRVTLNTDNRLMSHTTMTDEFRVAVDAFGCDLKDLERVTVNAMNAAFFPYADRHRIIDERIAPIYTALQQELNAPAAQNGDA